MKRRTFDILVGIAGAAIAAFIAAAVLLVLSGLGLVHARRTSSATELLPGPHEAEAVSAQ